MIAASKIRTEVRTEHLAQIMHVRRFIGYGEGFRVEKPTNTAFLSHRREG